MPDRTLVTSRLRLRPLDAHDRPGLLVLLNHPEVGRYLCDGQPVPLEMGDSILARSAADFARDGFGLFGVRERGIAPGSPLVGLAGFRIPAAGSPHGSEHPELLFALAPRLWNRGLSTEASHRALTFAFDELKVPRVTAAANPENMASWRVLERLGFIRTGLFPTGIEHLYTYDLRREAFESAFPRPEDP